jgi:hypothetical protein
VDECKPLFVGLPKSVEVKPSPYGEILSNETIELEVSYAPPTVRRCKLTR